MNIFLSCILTLLLAALLQVVTAADFFRELAALYTIPTWQDKDYTDLLASWWPLALAAGLAALMLVLLVLVNRKTLRRVFLFSGIALAVNVVLCIVERLLRIRMMLQFPAAMQDLLVGSSGAFADLLMLFALAEGVAAAVCFSIFASIRAARGGKSHEEIT